MSPHLLCLKFVSTSVRLISIAGFGSGSDPLPRVLTTTPKKANMNKTTFLARS